VRALHTQRKQLAVMFDVLIDRTLDKLCLLEARHQSRVADLLLGGLMNLDRGLCAHNGSSRYFGTAEHTTGFTKTPGGRAGHGVRLPWPFKPLAVGEYCWVGTGCR
jgi:hypothetical protein